MLTPPTRIGSHKNANPTVTSNPAIPANQSAGERIAIDGRGHKEDILDVPRLEHEATDIA